MNNRTHLVFSLTGLILLALLAFSFTPALSKAIKKMYKVPATVEWYNTRLQVSAGQKITIQASGKASTLKTSQKSESGPNGQVKYMGCGEPANAPPPCALYRAKYGALVGKIGSNPAFLIGKKLTFTARQSGILYLSVNDNLKYYTDNKGGYTVIVTTP